ncbi:class I SAM-dependent methyltransferase [Streptomyces sp. NPDC059957]|uniref:class I SAM-dependent methyltransferase n=1 Tax=Streptomyces sp. NPDC059957 TaxID=3347016 RepID=UPI00364DB061
MLERARESARVEGAANASFTQGDAQSHPFAPDTFDVAIGPTVRLGASGRARTPLWAVRLAGSVRPTGFARQW